MAGAVDDSTINIVVVIIIISIIIMTMKKGTASNLSTLLLIGWANYFPKFYGFYGEKTFVLCNPG